MMTHHFSYPMPRIHRQLYKNKQPRFPYDLPTDWLFLREAALSLPHSAFQEQLLFYIEEGVRLDSKQALPQMRFIAHAIAKLSKQESVETEMQDALSALLDYLNPVSSCSSLTTTKVSHPA